ncbi:GNAT family N-acetyltransferase [Ramlibacter algicola]|uniref:GNAT family N-acetyltransferase n=1 Tax=Ramlibacter algicola TaxID=2795217 RepID=A0A934UR51_9BURK|nr:GNAT family N-acetyltransferase [Ramlibacter algicola]MBK0392501.1 GNAT family N-acetyltransferase [Ramlibacter algicola]
MDAARPIEDVVIRAAEPADAAGMSAVIGRLGTVEGTLQIPDMPVASRIDHLQKIEPRDCKLVAVAGGDIVGVAGLHSVGMSLRRQHVRSLGIGIATEWQGRGLGRRMIERLLDWADNWAGVLRIELHVHAGNARAKRLYESLGFVEEGRHRGYAITAGHYEDSFSMARLHPNPPQIQK